VAITHKKRIGGTFVAHPTAKAAPRKSSSHSFFSLLVRQFLTPLLPPIDREIDGILARPDDWLFIEPIQGQLEEQNEFAREVERLKRFV
jgi:hypothetical protein